MKKYITPKTEILNINAQTILAASGDGSGTSTGGPSTSFGDGSHTIGQGGMEAKQTITSFLFND